MAKISAHGDREKARFERDGAVIVQTVKGRVLRKFSREATYTLVGRGATDDAVRRYAASLGYEPTTTRRVQ